jgi:general secretion pathway protein N
MNIRAARLTTNVLAAGCAGLALIVILQYAGFGRGFRWATDDAPSEAHGALGDIDKQPLKMPPASAFAAVEAHPLFNEDRQPTPVDPNAGSEAVPPPSPLNVALTGVILDEQNQVRVAMLQDKTRNQAVALKVGMPLEGDQSSWTLVEVKPRGAVFRNAANETAEVELETAVMAQQGGAPRSGANNTGKGPAGGRPNNNMPPRPGGAARPDAKPVDASNDLARRIEERRKQMREDAERLRNGANPAQQKK